MDRSGGEMPGTRRGRTPQQDTDDERQPMRFHQADRGMRRTGKDGGDRAARKESAENIRGEAAGRREQKKDCVGAQDRGSD